MSFHVQDSGALAICVTVFVTVFVTIFVTVFVTVFVIVFVTVFVFEKLKVSMSKIRELFPSV